MVLELFIYRQSIRSSELSLVDAFKTNEMSEKQVEPLDIYSEYGSWFSLHTSRIEIGWTSDMHDSGTRVIKFVKCSILQICTRYETSCTLLHESHRDGGSVDSFSFGVFTYCKHQVNSEQRVLFPQ
jgi:hypothetical protein